jgi:hypothetical protein
MMDGKLSREHIRRRILDNLNWANLPYQVVEALPLPLPPPNLPANTVEKPSEQPTSSAKHWAHRLITSIPFLGRVAIVIMMPVLLPLSAAGTLAARLQNAMRKIEELNS